MAAGAVAHQRHGRAGDHATEGGEELLEAAAVEMRQEQDDALAAGRLDRDVEPEPFVAVLDGPRRAGAARAPASAVPHLQPEAGLIHGEGPRRPVPRQLGPELLF
jgi:hypothetical protein